MQKYILKCIRMISTNFRIVIPVRKKGKWVEDWRGGDSTGSMMFSLFWHGNEIVLNLRDGCMGVSRIVSWLVYHLKCCPVLKHFESGSVLENNLKVCTWQIHFKKYFILFCFKQGFFFLSLEMVVKTFSKVWGTGNNNWEHLRALALN